MFFPLPLYIALLGLGRLVWRRGRLDREEKTFWLLVLIVGTWASVLVGLALNQDLASIYGQFVLETASLIGFAFGVIVAFGYLFWPSHGQLAILRQVYEKWLQAHIWKGELRIGIGISIYPPDEPESSMPVEKLEHFSRAEAYLKHKHRKIYDDWTETTELVAKYNDLAPKRHEFLEELLKSQMKLMYPKLTESNPSVENNYYYLPLLISAFESHAGLYDDEWKVRLYEHPHKNEDNRPSTLKSTSQILISSDDVSDIQLTKLEGVFDRVKSNPQYVQMSNDLVQFELQAEQRMKDFVAKLRDLCDRIDFHEV